MKSKIDCIASYHLDYLTCGVARVNEKIKIINKLKVYHFSKVPKKSTPLLSIKFSEFNNTELIKLYSWSKYFKGNFDTFIHGFDGKKKEIEILKNSRRNIACNNEIAKKMTDIGFKNVISSCCPCSNLAKNLSPFNEGYKILSFGMAHKILTRKYNKLKNFFNDSCSKYSIRFSTAVHDGFDLEKSFLLTEQFISRAFGNKGMFLGMLSDDALIHYLKRSDFFATFFPNGYRENNTSVNTAFENKICVITNIDKYSPKWMVHGETFLDINKMKEFNLNKKRILQIANNGHKVYKENINWKNVISQLALL